MKAVAAKLGIGAAETVRTWVRKAVGLPHMVTHDCGTSTPQPSSPAARA